MKAKKTNFILSIIFFVFCSCDNTGINTDLQSAIDSVRQQYVPDSRDDVYDISLIFSDVTPVVRGFTSVAEAKEDLLLRMHAIRSDVIDSISVLPEASLEERIYAVVNVSVADLRTSPAFSAEMATQLLLGMPIHLLQTRGSWYRVRTPEGYIAWIQRGTIVRKNGANADEWRNAAKIIFTGEYGFTHEMPDERSQRVSDLVFGNLLKLEGDNGHFFHVSYPDGRTAYVHKSQSMMFDDWKNSIHLTEESIVAKAYELKGIPYTWGGTSVKSMDCSGFSKTVYLKHGIVLRRDASQQAKTGIPVDISEGYDNLRPGDLLFFGRKAEDNRPERIRHVAIYAGNKEFIHTSDMVRVNSLDPQQPHFDELNTAEFIRASRILGAVNDDEAVWEWKQTGGTK